MRKVSNFGSLFITVRGICSGLLVGLGFYIAYILEFHWLGKGIPELTEASFVVYSLGKLIVFIICLLLTVSKNKNLSMDLENITSITKRHYIGFLLNCLTFFIMAFTFSEKSVMLLFRIFELLRW